MPIPATLIFKFASETAESTSSGQLIVPALRTSPVSTEGTVPVSMDASRASLTPLSVPVSASPVVVAVPSSPRTVVRTAAASPVTVGVVLVVLSDGTDSCPPRCAKPIAGQASRPAIRRATRPKADRPCFV